MRRGFSDVMLSIAALAILLAVLVSVDDRVREQISYQLSASPSAEIANASGQVRSLGGVVYQVVKDQVQSHGPLTVFVVAATVLTVFMLRT